RYLDIDVPGKSRAHFRADLHAEVQPVYGKKAVARPRYPENVISVGGAVRLAAVVAFVILQHRVARVHHIARVLGQIVLVAAGALLVEARLVRDLPRQRRAPLVSSRPAVGFEHPGEPTGSDCRLLPGNRAREQHHRRKALAETSELGEQSVLLVLRDEML